MVGFPKKYKRYSNQAKNYINSIYFPFQNENYDTNVISQNSGVTDLASRLVINYLLPRHQDEYTCQAETEGTKVKKIYNLFVFNKSGREMNLTELIASKILGAHHLPRVTFWARSLLDLIGEYFQSLKGIKMV